MNEAQKKRLAIMPTSMQQTYRAAVGDGQNASKAKAIVAMCQECAGYERKTIRHCTSEACPLWPHRPYQEKES